MIPRYRKLEFMKRIGVSVFLAIALLVSALPSANGVVTSGSKCSKAGAKQTYKGKVYTCIKLGSKLYWNNGVKIATRIPSSSSQATPTSTPTPTPLNSKVESSDLQFIYGTSTTCGGEIGFFRMSKDGVAKKDKTIVKADPKYSITPLDYQNDELLFSSEICDSSKVGSVSTIWRLNLGNKNATPKEVYSLTYQGTRNGLILDAKIDLASSKILVLAWVNGDQQLFTAESNPLLIWSQIRQGWQSAGIYASGFDVGTGWSLSVYGESNSRWRSVYVDWRTEIAGIGKISLRGYGTNAQFQGIGLLKEVKTGLLKMPYIFNTSQGVYVCADYPTTSGPIVDVDTSSRCNRISGSQLGQLATSFAGQNGNKVLEAIISLSDRKAYIYETGPWVGTWDPVQISKIIDLKSAFSKLPGIYFAVSTHEISWDIGELSPTLTFKGFFTTSG